MQPGCKHEKLFDERCIECGKVMSRVELEDYIFDGPKNNKNMILKETIREKNVVKDDICALFDLDNTCVHSVILKSYDCIAIPSNIDVITEVDRMERRRPIDDENSVNLVGFKNCFALVKIRPGLISVLERLSKDFKIGIFSLGSTDYALALRDIIDPGHTLIKLGVYTRDDCNETGSKEIKKLFEVAPNNIVIWDDTSTVWKGHGQLLKCEGWYWDKYRTFRLYDNKNEKNHYSKLPCLSKQLVSITPPVPPSMIVKQCFWPCIQRPPIMNWMYQKQLENMEKVFKEVHKTIKETHKPSSLILFEIRRRIFKDLTFTYDEEYIETVKKAYKYHPSFNINDYELTLMIRAFGGNVTLNSLTSETLLISNYNIEGKTCIPPCWVFYCTILMKRIDLSLISTMQI